MATATSSFGVGALTSLDKDADGRLDASELMSAFDADGDGTLDLREMEKLAARLSAQVRCEEADPISSSLSLSSLRSVSLLYGCRVT